MENKYILKQSFQKIINKILFLTKRNKLYKAFAIFQETKQKLRMKRFIYFGTLGIILIIYSCGSTNTTTKESLEEESLETTLQNKNRANISLYNEIRQLPGIVLRNGLPTFVKNSTSISQQVSVEPLYILNDYIVGNSFSDIDQLVQNIDIKKIEVFKDSDTSFYGSRGANGVIKITTY